MKKKATLINLLKYFFAAAPIVWIMYRIDLGKMSQLFTAISPPWIFLIIINFLTIIFFFQSVRMWVLLRTFIPEISFRKFFTVHCMSMYYSLMLPSGSSKDIVRGMLLSKENNFKYVWGATWLSKLFAFISQLLLPAAGFFVLWLRGVNLTLHSWIIYSFAGAVTVVSISTILSFSKTTTSFLSRYISPLIPRKILSVVRDIREGIYLYRSQKKAILKSFVLTLLMQGLMIFNTSVIIKAITGSFYFWEIFAFRPLIEIISIVMPFTPNGMGIRELLCTFFFNGYLGISLEKTGVYVLIIFSSNILRLLGGIAVFKNICSPVRNRS